MNARPLALGLATLGALLREKTDERWQDLLDDLIKSNLEEVRLKFPNYEYPSLRAAMQASVQDLPSDIERRYYDLAVFPDDAAIPETARERFGELIASTCADLYPSLRTAHSRRSIPRPSFAS